MSFQVEKPNIIVQNWRVFISHTLTANNKHKFALIINTTMPCPRTGTSSYDLKLTNSKRRRRTSTVVSILELESINVV